MDVLVLGGDGRLGSRFVKALRDAGLVVGATTRRRDGRGIFFEAGKTPVARLPKAQVWINALGIISETAETSFASIHYELVEEIVASFGGDAPYLIHISALGADMNSESQFLATKGRAEALIKARLQNYAIVRPSVVCTRGTMLAANLWMLAGFARWSPILALPYEGRTWIQPVLSKDLMALVLALVETRDTCVVDVVGDEAFEVRSLLEMACRLRGSKAHLWPLPLPVAKGLASLFGVVAWRFFDRERLLMMAGDNVADVKPFLERVGRRPSSARGFFNEASNYVS